MVSLVMQLAAYRCKAAASEEAEYGISLSHPFRDNHQPTKSCSSKSRSSDLTDLCCMQATSPGASAEIEPGQFHLDVNLSAAEQLLEQFSSILLEPSSD
jgi:hypothetical protein